MKMLSYRWIWPVFLLAFTAVAVTSAAAQETLAQATRVNWPYQTWIDPDTFRGPGFYFSIFKILACGILFLCWVKSADWVNQDLQFHRLRIHTWNPIVVVCFSFALLLMWVIPYFWLGFILLIAAYFGPLLTYIFYYRNPLVDEHLHVLTPPHLRFLAAGKLAYVGIHIDAEDPAAELNKEGPTIDFFATEESSKQENQARNIQARQLVGYAAIAGLFADAYERRASQILLNFGQETGIRYMIDSIWHNLPPQSLETGRQITDVLVCLALGNDEAHTPLREKDVEANFAFQIRRLIDASSENISLALTGGQRDKFEGMWEEMVSCKLVLAIGERFERWVVQLNREAKSFHTLEDLGMREKTSALLTKALQQPNGMLLFSALPAGGLTTTLNTALESVDRYMRDFVSIEDKDQREPEIANVDAKIYTSATGETPADILPAVSRAGPDVIVCRNLVNLNSTKMLCEFAQGEHLVITSILARDGLEALLRVLVMKVPPELFAAAISTVVHGRLIRKLCEACREPYTPSAELLKKLGIPPGKVEHLYQPPKGQSETICDFCDGIGYSGLTGIYEVLTVTEEMQRILVSGQPQMESLRKAARAAGLQREVEHGKLLVAIGTTSVEELQRIFKA
jgi:type II secretory ATPase GspE/PulE/Tfp pilus assembly ATPase PilB-like protein